MTTLVQDVRYALRSLRRSTSFAVVAILTLALGIGANSAIFSVLDGVLLRPLPYPRADRLVMVWTDSVAEGLAEERSAYGNYEDWRLRSSSFEELAAFDPYSATLTGDGPAEQVSATWVSASFFATLGVPPLLGRTFTEQEATERQSLVVLSHGLWRSRFGSSTDVLGTSLEIDGRLARVVGVMPSGFAFPDPGTDLWQPATLSEGFEAQRVQRGIDAWFVLGRLKPGVSLGEARAEMDGLAAALAEAHPRENAGLGVSLVPLHDQVTGERLRAGLWVLFGAVVFVLLIACTNVANLLLARAAARERELAIRSSLGASRGRILRQLLTESAVLAVIAGIAGLLLAQFLIDAVVTYGPAEVPRLAEVRLDERVLLFTLGLSLLVGAVFGIAPAWRLTAADPAPALKEGGRGVSSGPGPRRAGASLVVVEVALAVVLVTGAGLLLQSLRRVQAVDPGFRRDDVLMMQLSVPRERSPEQRVAFCREAIARIEALPGVAAAGAVNDFFIPNRPDQAIFVEGGSGSSSVRRHVAAITAEAVSGSYFSTVGLPLRGGRLFDEFDGPGSTPVAVINETMAERFWPGQDPLGKRFARAGVAAALQPPEDARWIEVVGVVGDARRQSLERRPIPQVYRPHAQDPSRLMTLLVRSEGDPGPLTAAIRTQVAEVDPAVPLYHATTLAERLRRSVAGRRFQAGLLALFSILALALAATGIYGLMHQSVSRRTHEIGVRMALGASRGAVQRMVLGHGLALASMGVAVGVLGSTWLGGVLGALLYEVSATDPGFLAGGALTLLAIAMVACYMPARRATRVDPLLALRQE